MRDLQLKNEAERIEVTILRLLGTVGQIAEDCYNEGAGDHADFYTHVATKLSDAQQAVEAAYTLLLNGDGLNIEPLVQA